MLFRVAIVGTSIEVRPADSLGRFAICALFCARHFYLFGGVVRSCARASSLESFAGGLHGDDECIAGVRRVLPHHFLPRQSRKPWPIQAHPKDDLGEIRVLLGFLAGNGRANCGD